LNGINAVLPAMVKISSGSNQWTGVMVDARGLILTTSFDLGTAPIATFTTQGGLSGTAWVFGRNDNLDLVLLEVINPAGTFDAVKLYSGRAPDDTQTLGMLQYPSAGSLLSQQETRVEGSRRDLNGIQYLQLRALRTPGAQGAAVIDNLGNLVGMRMNDAQMLKLVISRPGETWAMDGNGLVQMVLPALRAGVSIVNPEPDACAVLEGTFPPLPYVFLGDVTVGAVPVPVGRRIYARLNNFTSSQERWFSSIIDKEGRYQITASICEEGFQNGIVDFWLDGSQAAQTATVPNVLESIFRERNLAFP
jgi:hypothetical protein